MIIKQKFRQASKLPPTSMSNYINYMERGGSSMLDNPQEEITYGVTAYKFNKMKEVRGFTEEELHKDFSEQPILFSDVGNDISELKQSLLEAKGNIWIPIISFKESEALQAGLESQVDFRTKARTFVNMFSEAAEVPKSNLNYMAVFHQLEPSEQKLNRDSGAQPHLHFIIWEKESHELKGAIPKDRLMKLADKTKSLFLKQRLTELEKNNIRSDLNLSLSSSLSRSLSDINQIAVSLDPVTGKPLIEEVLESSDSSKESIERTLEDKTHLNRSEIKSLISKLYKNDIELRSSTSETQEQRNELEAMRIENLEKLHAMYAAYSNISELAEDLTMTEDASQIEVFETLLKAKSPHFSTSLVESAIANYGNVETSISESNLPATLTISKELNLKLEELSKLSSRKLSEKSSEEIASLSLELEKLYDAFSQLEKVSQLSDIEAYIEQEKVLENIEVFNLPELNEKLFERMKSDVELYRNLTSQRFKQEEMVSELKMLNEMLPLSGQNEFLYNSLEGLKTTFIEQHEIAQELIEDLIGERKYEMLMVGDLSDDLIEKLVVDIGEKPLNDGIRVVDLGEISNEELLNELKEYANYVIPETGFVLEELNEVKNVLNYVKEHDEFKELESTLTLNDKELIQEQKERHLSIEGDTQTVFLEAQPEFTTKEWSMIQIKWHGEEAIDKVNELMQEIDPNYPEINKFRHFEFDKPYERNLFQKQVRARMGDVQDAVSQLLGEEIEERYKVDVPELRSDFDVSELSGEQKELLNKVKDIIENTKVLASVEKVSEDVRQLEMSDELNYEIKGQNIVANNRDRSTYKNIMLGLENRKSRDKSEIAQEQKEKARELREIKDRIEEEMEEYREMMREIMEDARIEEELELEEQERLYQMIIQLEVMMRMNPNAIREDVRHLALINNMSVPTPQEINVRIERYREDPMPLTFEQEDRLREWLPEIPENVINPYAGIISRYPELEEDAFNSIREQAYVEPFLSDVKTHDLESTQDWYNSQDMNPLDVSSWSEIAEIMPEIAEINGVEDWKMPPFPLQSKEDIQEYVEYLTNPDDDRFDHYFEGYSIEEVEELVNN